MEVGFAVLGPARKLESKTLDTPTKPKARNRYSKPRTEKPADRVGHSRYRRSCKFTIFLIFEWSVTGSRGIKKRRLKPSVA